MSWHINYALEYFSKNSRTSDVQHESGDAILISMPHRPKAVAIISPAYAITTESAKKYHSDYPEMDFLCGYRTTCVWEGGAIKYLEMNAIGWGSAGTLNSAINNGNVNTASHKDYFFAYRLVRQISHIKLDREFDRIFTATLTGGRKIRVGMIGEYEPTADAIRTFWDRFGPIDIAWNINPNGNPTTSFIDAGLELGCKAMNWSELKKLLRKSS